MNIKVVELTTDESLLEALKRTASHKPTQEERQQQQVSFIYGSMKDESGITKEQVRRALNKD